MANPKQAQAQAPQEPKEVKLVGKIVNVVYSESLKRVGIVTDQSFKAFDQEHKEVNSDTFRLNVYTLASQTAAFVPHIKMAQALSLGKGVQPELFSLSLIGADVEFTRTFHEENEERETLKADGTPEIFEKDTWTTEITKVVPHIDPLFQPMLMEYVKPAKKVVTTTEVTANPFNV